MPTLHRLAQRLRAKADGFPTVADDSQPLAERSGKKRERCGANKKSWESYAQKLTGRRRQ
jgi:hypothetical protein